jgi:hypothetical protein
MTRNPRRSSGLSPIGPAIGTLVSTRSRSSYQSVISPAAYPNNVVYPWLWVEVLQPLRIDSANAPFTNVAACGICVDRALLHQVNCLAVVQQQAFRDSPNAGAAVTSPRATFAGVSCRNGGLLFEKDLWRRRKTCGIRFGVVSVQLRYSRESPADQAL